MTQTIILNKFIKYLEYEKKNYLQELDDQLRLNPSQAARIAQQKKEFLARNTKLTESLKNGHCFGFSLVHAAMDCMDKLDWWEEALVDIANWDEQESSLDNEVKLPNTIEDKPLKRKDITARVMHYIIESRFEVANNYFPGLNYRNILQPDGYHYYQLKSKIPPSYQSCYRSYFEMLDENATDQNSKIKTVQKRKIIAGHLTKEQLMEDLTDDFPEKAIILVHNHNHTIRIARKGVNWVIYNPEYSHKSGPIRKIVSKSECIDEIFKIHKTSSIALEVACFDNTEVHFPHYDNLVKTNPESLLKEGGLLIILRHATNVLSEVIKQMDNSSRGKSLLKTITEELHEKSSLCDYTTLHLLAQLAPGEFFEMVKRIDSSPEGKAFFQKITQLLSEKNSYSWTVLHVLAHSSPDALFEMVKRLDGSPEGKEFLQKITPLLSEKISDGRTVLHMFALHSSNALFEMIKRLDGSPEGKDFFQKITQLLSEKNSDGWTVLHVLARYSNDALFEMVKRINDSPEEEGKASRTAVLAALGEKINDNYTVFSLISDPKKIVDIIRFFTRADSIQSLLNMPNGLDKLLNILSAKTLKNKTIWQIICDKLPDAKSRIMNSINKHLKVMHNEELTVYEKEIRRAAYDKNAKYRGICKKSGFFHGKYVKTDLYQDMQVTIQQTIEQNLQKTMQKHNSAKLGI